MNADEIKEKRKMLKMTQDDLAKELGVDRRTVINYEKGEIIPESKVKLLDMVFKSKSETMVREPEAVYVKNWTEMQVMHVPLVSYYAQAGYLSGFGDPDYLDSLPKIPFSADVEHKGDYLCFEVRGDSMDDGSSASILERDILLCRNVRKEYWRSKLHINKWRFVIVHRTEGILVKEIIKHDVASGVITIHSLNDMYDDQELHLKDVSQIFNIVEIRRK
jgi:DNA-binding XRE family transcriptional regulator